MMMNVVLALLLLLQGTTAARPGVVMGQLQTRTARRLPLSASPRFRRLHRTSVRPTVQNYYSTPVLRARRSPTHRDVPSHRPRARHATSSSRASSILDVRIRQVTTSADRATVINVGYSPVNGINFTVLMPPGGRASGRVDTPPTANAREKAVLSGVALPERKPISLCERNTSQYLRVHIVGQLDGHAELVVV